MREWLVSRLYECRLGFLCLQGDNDRILFLNGCCRKELNSVTVYAMDRII